MDRSQFKIQGIDYSYNDVKDDITAYIEERLENWNNYVAYDDDEKVELIAVELHGSRLRNQAREDSDLDVVFEFASESVTEDTLFNFMNYDEDEEPYTYAGISVDFNPIKAGDMGPIDDYMARSDEYDRKRVEANESVEILRDAGYVVEDFKSTLGKAAAIGALAAGAAFGNSGIQSKSVGPNNVPNDTVGFGKTSVHLQQRYNYPSTRYGVPKSFELPAGEKQFEISHKDEIEMTKAKILATPDSILHKYGKKHPTELANLFVRTATKYNVDIDILLAIAGSETGYDVGLQSDKKAIGMMQITPIAAWDSHHRLQGKDSTTFDFSSFAGLEKSIDNAGRLVADISNRRNNVIEMIFATYNGGTAQATAWRYAQLGRTKLPDGKCAPKLTKETREYVDKCVMLYGIYKKVQNTYKL